MPVLKTVVEDAAKIRFRQMAKARNLSESEFLRAVVGAVTEEGVAPPAPATPEPGQTQTERLTVRMPAFVLDAAKARAKAQGMAPSRWVAALVQTHVTAEPVLTDAELTAVLEANRELAAVGRNINQIARALNEAFHETERVRLEKLAELERAIARQREALRQLVKASRNAWGVADGTD